MAIPHFWEPEETVGTAWHRIVQDYGSEPCFEAARVPYEEVRGSVNLLFRALGGVAGTEILPVASDVAESRVLTRRKLAHDVEHITYAHFNGQRLALPLSIALFEDRALNRGLYLWLAAMAAFITVPDTLPQDALKRDLALLSACLAAEQRVLAELPGFRGLRVRLGQQLAADRPKAALPPMEASLEAALLPLLVQDNPREPEPFLVAILRNDASHLPWAATESYKTFRPLSLWPQLALPEPSEGAVGDDDHSADKGESAEGSEKILKARRHAGDQADRKDSLILHRFETILSWVEFLNINRRVDDEEEDVAKKAAQDLNEISLAKNSKSAKTKLKFHLDLAPKDLDRTRLIGENTYPEWDWKSASYLPDHVIVEERIAEERDTDALETPRARRRIEAVRKQFEALRPRRQVMRRQPEGFELDIDEVIRARCDFLASGDASDRIFKAIRNEERDLAVSVLIDTSRSTESAVSGRPVIECAREALVALVAGLEKTGDAVSVHGFSSLKRDKVMIEKVKDFADTDAALVRRRIMGLSPKFYTRLGAALRHVSAHLARQSAEKRLLLVITDGKPNDLDHYEGRHGIEDTRRAIAEARRLGQAVFGIAVDAKAQDYVPYLFGTNGYAMVPDPDKLIEALPQMYKHVVA